MSDGSLLGKGFLTLVITLLLLSPVFPYPYQSAQRLGPTGHPISTFYYAREDETETWIEIVPDVRQNKLKPMRLNFSVKTRGKSVLTPPDSVTLTPILDPLYDPNMRRQPVARLLLDGQQQLDLKPTIANLIGQTHVGASVLSPCEGCAPDRIITTIPADTFRKIVLSQKVEGAALGLDFFLSAEQLDVLRGFAKHVKLLPSSRR